MEFDVVKGIEIGYNLCFSPSRPLRLWNGLSGFTSDTSKYIYSPSIFVAFDHVVDISQELIQIGLLFYGIS